MFRLFMTLLLFTAPNMAYAQPTQMIGKWAVRAGGQTVMIVEIKETGKGLIAIKSRPEKGSINQNHIAVDLGGAAKDERLIELARKPNAVEFSREDPTNEVIVIENIDADHLSFSFKNVPFASILLSRAKADEAVSTDWSNGTMWALDEPWPDNKEIARLFADDQKARLSDGAINWDVVAVEDAKRRLATQQLLDEGQLRSATDFYYAAFIFQHGDKPEDYLKAHSLAIIAASKGEKSAAWIAAATLDRYLMNIGHPQIYGTQYKMRENEPVTQEPYSRAIISDPLRQAMGVPDLATQEENRKKYEAENRKGSSASN